jgi:hypothetical protein
MALRPLPLALAALAAAGAAAGYRLAARQMELSERLATLERSQTMLRAEAARFRADTQAALVRRQDPGYIPQLARIGESLRAMSMPEDYRPLEPQLRRSVTTALARAAAGQRPSPRVLVDYRIGRVGQIQAASELIDILREAGIRAELGKGQAYGEHEEQLAVQTHPDTAAAGKAILSAAQPFLKADASWQSDSLVKIGDILVRFYGTPQFRPDGSLSYPNPPPEVKVQDEP